MPKGPITSGVDHNYWNRIVVSDPNFPNDAQAVLQFKSYVNEFILTHEAGAAVEYSFNGNTKHGEVDATNRPQVQFKRPVSKIWFRSAGGTISVEGWAVV
jgi:hypothetical protein